jgi:hypothetical protein
MKNNLFVLLALAFAGCGVAKNQDYTSEAKQIGAQTSIPDTDLNRLKIVPLHHPLEHKVGATWCKILRALKADVLLVESDVGTHRLL